MKVFPKLKRCSSHRELCGEQISRCNACYEKGFSILEGSNIQTTGKHMKAGKQIPFNDFVTIWNEDGQDFYFRFYYWKVIGIVKSVYGLFS